jgi:hypothetical protein
MDVFKLTIGNSRNQCSSISPLGRVLGEAPEDNVCDVSPLGSIHSPTGQDGTQSQSL